MAIIGDNIGRVTVSAKEADEIRKTTDKEKEIR